jgi:hypothetical protein
VQVLLEPGVITYYSRWVRQHCYAKAAGWLERRNGAWLQDLGNVRHSHSLNLSCSRAAVPIVLGATQQPSGYADYGPCMM